MTPNDPALNPSHVYHDKCNNADCSVTVVKKLQDYPKGASHVLLPLFFYCVTEVLSNSEILSLERSCQ